MFMYTPVTSFSLQSITGQVSVCLCECVQECVCVCGRARLVEVHLPEVFFVFFQRESINQRSRCVRVLSVGSYHCQPSLIGPAQVKGQGSKPAFHRRSGSLALAAELSQRPRMKNQSS